METCAAISLLLNLSLLSTLSEQGQRYGSLLSASIDLQNAAVDDWFAGREFLGLSDRAPAGPTLAEWRRGRVGLDRTAFGARPPSFARDPFTTTNPDLQGLGGVGSGGDSSLGGIGQGDGILPPPDQRGDSIKDEEIDLATKMIGQPEPSSIIVWLAVVLVGAQAAQGRNRG